jgi:hypothetical protein
MSTPHGHWRSLTPLAAKSRKTLDQPAQLRDHEPSTVAFLAAKQADPKTDVASGLNYKRRGLTRFWDKIHKGVAESFASPVWGVERDIGQQQDLYMHIMWRCSQYSS